MNLPIILPYIKTLKDAQQELVDKCKVAYCPMEFEYFENLLDDINIAIFKLESSLKLLNQELIDFNNLIFEYNSYTNETYTEITFPNGHYVYIQLTTLTNSLKENLYQLEIYAGSFNKEIQKYQNWYKPYTKEEVIEILHLIQLLPTN